MRPSSEKIGIVNGFGCFPDKVTAEKNTGTFIPDDFEHEIATDAFRHNSLRSSGT